MTINMWKKIINKIIIFISTYKCIKGNMKCLDFKLELESYQSSFFYRIYKWLFKFRIEYTVRKVVDIVLGIKNYRIPS